MKKIDRQFLVQNWHLVALVVLSLLTVWPLLLPGYFSHHDDLQVMRIFEMRRCFQDLQIPCRWVPDMGYGNGYPMFNYYGVLPYYIGAILSFVLGYIGAAKALFLISLLLGFISTFLLAEEIFHNRNLAFLSAVLFGFAPYRALDVYVRGALDENFAISIVPLIFYFSLRLIKKSSKSSFLGLALSLAALLTTHNIMTLFFLPLLLIWIIFWIVKEKSKNSWSVSLAMFLGFGLAAFFILPAFLEKGLVQTDNLIKLDLDFRAHFATFKQLFWDRAWGYGASIPGDKDTISFQIGWPQWWLVIVSLLFIIYQSIKKGGKFLHFWMLFIFFAEAVFMTHNKAAFVWEKIPILAYAQFPWRFLAVIIFSVSILGVWWLDFLPRKISLMAITLLVAITVGLNLSFFKPETFYPNLTDAQKLSGKLWDDQQKAAILDYLPQGAIEARERAASMPSVTSGQAEISQFINKSNSFSFQAKVDQAAQIEVPVYDFPNWTTYIDQAKTPHSHKNLLSRISIGLGSGQYQVEGKLENTPIRTLANILSLLSAVFLTLLLYGKNRKIFV